MTHISRHRKILIIISANIFLAFIIAFVSQWLSYKNVIQDSIPVRELNKLYILTFLEVFVFTILSLFLLSFLLIKITRPLLEDLLHNEKDLNKIHKQKKKSERALFTLIKNFPVGLVSYNVKEDMTYFNDYAINYLGFTSNQFRVKGLVGPALRLIHEDGSDMPVAEYPLNEVIATQTILKNKVGGIVGKSGNVVWVKYNAFPVFGSLRGLKQVIVTFLDITDQKQMEIALKDTNSKLHEQSEELTRLFDNLKEINTKLAESEARYKLISDFSTGWETYRHPDGKLIYCSPAVEKVIGFTQEEYLNGIPFASFVHPDDLDRFMEHFNNGLAGKIVPSCVVRFLHKNQTVRWVDFALKPVLSESGEMLGVRYSSKDITKLKENEQELKELNATKDKFFSIISHDLKSPFHSLIGLSDILLQEHELHSVEQREEIISLINEASKNTFKLLENLLAWTRSQSGQLVPNQSKVNLRQLLLEITDLLRSTAQNKKISLENTVNNDIWVWVDSDILNTIIRNLISNSIKYTKECGKVTLSASLKDGFAEVSVSDTGIGFDDSMLNTLFKIGENRSTPGTSNETGTGLGLILCKDFVEKSGGQIWAKSEIGNGSNFYFTIPLCKNV